MFRIHITGPHRHGRFLLHCSHQALVDLMRQLEDQGVAVDVRNADAAESLPLVFVPDPVGDRIPKDPQVPWFVWDWNSLPGIHRDAQEEGALCVLPAKLSLTSLLNALQTADLVLEAQLGGGFRSLTRNHEKNELIHLEEDRVVFIRRGVVRCTSIHMDGSEVLIGIYGSGDVLMAHASYECHAHSCHVEMRAHTPLAVTLEAWGQAIKRPDFYDRLKQRVCQLELWASMQARPSAEDRLWGILQVIGARFAKQTEQGMVFQIKLTHEQLAGAIGATRTTVTRLLGNLRKKGMLRTIKTPLGEFLALTAEVEQCLH